MNERQVEAGFQMILEGLGLDWQNDPHLKDTPLRCTRAWVDELAAGLTGELLVPELRAFDNPGDSGMVVLGNIPIKSMCAHHLLPFVGTAVIGYIGNGKILGLSKLSRIANYYARRPQVQEQLTNQIADALIHPPGIHSSAVMIRADHHCMHLRGVNHPGHMVTSALRGAFDVDPTARAEFFSLAKEINHS